MKEKYEKFHIGINVFVIRNKKLLLGKRKNVYGAGTWGLPGGHLEYGEGMNIVYEPRMKNRLCRFFSLCLYV